MGSVFGFVGSDVKDKLGILCKHRASPSDGSRYSTIKQMLLYETSSPELLEPLRTSKNSTLPSASRTLLRLHRALRFIMMFMEGLISAADDESVARLAQESYKNSLAAFHPWLIRTGAHCAMYTLGTKYQMMEKVSKHSYAEVTKFAKKMTVAMKPVYDKTEQLYSEFNLHGLPWKKNGESWKFSSRLNSVQFQFGERQQSLLSIVSLHPAICCDGALKQTCIIIWYSVLCVLRFIGPVPFARPVSRFFYCCAV